MIDPMLPLAISVAEGRGVYALFLGSGVSREAGVATGSDILWDTIRIIYKEKEKKDPPEERASLQAWFEHSEYAGLGYSQILQQLFPTRGDRHQFLVKYFEGKEPGPSHKCIAEMVEKGLVKVILTTNFDSLIEHALDERKIAYNVIASDDDVKNVTPLEHANCWVMKLHGDYQLQNIKNTPKEVANLEPGLKEKFQEIVNRHGVVVIGYSGLDEGVMTVLRSRYPRYGIYWVTQSGEVNVATKAILREQDGRIIEGRTSSGFLSELLRRVESYQSADRGDTVSEITGLMKAIIRKGDYVEYIEQLKRQRRKVQQIWPKIYEELKPTGSISMEELKRVKAAFLARFANSAETSLALGLVVLEYNKLDWFDDFLKIFQDFVDTFENIESRPGTHWSVLDGVPVIYAGFMWWVLCSCAFNKEQWEIIKKLREFRVYHYSNRPSITLKEEGSFASETPWNDFDSSFLRQHLEKEFLMEYFQSRDRLIERLIETNFIICLLAVKEGIKLLPWFRRYHPSALDRLNDRLKNDRLFATDLATNLFEESYGDFTSKFAERCDKLNEFISEHYHLHKTSCDLFLP